MNHFDGWKMLVNLSALKIRNNFSPKEGKVQRWALFLQQYDISLIHILGGNNVVAHWLSSSLEDDIEADYIIEQVFPHQHSLFRMMPQLQVNKLYQPYVPTVDDFQIG
eukprot:GHVS01057782.1.p1 GENE.GHVS01057782.1~~GHVS01057782.1.p1  ORF type:complete len:108 (-),score=6.75 GHVS01057782.1:263-586(-)